MPNRPVPSISCNVCGYYDENIVHVCSEEISKSNSEVIMSNRTICRVCGFDDNGTGDSSHVCNNSVHYCKSCGGYVYVYSKIQHTCPPEAVGVKQQVDPTKASRFNTGKSRWSLVSFEALEPMVEVLEFGAEKYAPGNWANGGGLSHSETMESLARHLFALMRGEDIDPESGKPHIGHIQCNAMFLGHFYKHPEEFNRDDRVLLGSRNNRKEK